MGAGGLSRPHFNHCFNINRKLRAIYPYGTASDPEIYNVITQFNAVLLLCCRHDTETDYQVPTTAHEHVNDRPYSSLSMDSRYPALPLQPLPQPPSPGEDDETYHTIDDYYQTAS